MYLWLLNGGMFAAHISSSLAHMSFPKPTKSGREASIESDGMRQSRGEGAASGVRTDMNRLSISPGETVDGPFIGNYTPMAYNVGDTEELLSYSGQRRGLP
jgi:hypothetical protein